MLATAFCHLLIGESPLVTSDAPKPNVEIRTCTPDLLPAAAEVLSQAFAQETYTLLTLGKRANNREDLLALFHLQVDDHHNRGGFVDVALIDGEVVGAAMWEHPEDNSDTTAGVIKNLGTYIRLTGPRALRTLVGTLRVAARRPKESHWYLHMVGASPERQGLGIGSKLLQHGLERIDTSEPAYLESSNDGTSRLYRKFGFETAGTIKLWPGYSIDRMWRSAQP